MIHNPKQIIVRTYTINSSLHEQPITNRSLNEHLPPQSRLVKKLSKIHHSHKCNKQKHPSIIPQSNEQPTKNKRIDIFEHRYRRVHTQAKKHINSKTVTKSQSKAVKIFLPNLKKFDDFDYQTDRIVKPNVSSPRQMEREDHLATPIDKVTSLENNIRVENISLPHPPKKDSGNQQTLRLNDSHKAHPHSKVYKYIENYLNNDSTATKKKPTRQEDQYSVDSFAPTFQKEPNVIFHQFKHKASQPKKRNPSFLQKPLFDLSKIKQNLNQFVLSYVPFNRYFDIKEFIRNPSVKILSEQQSIFVGTITNNRKEGKGVLLTEKQLFEGEFFHNLKKFGYEKNKNGIYHGGYEQGRRSGIGKFVWANGETYEGEWRSGQKNGHGIWKSPKGDYYEGEWKQNLQHGKGCYFHKGCSMYRGYFKSSLKHGRGQQQFQNGDKYQGQYSKGKPHGYGKYVWANGDTYEGEFIDGSRQGKGILKKTIGEVYQGQFKGDLKDGAGKQIYTKGQYFQGSFQKGIKISGSYFSKQGRVLQSY